MTEIRCVVDRIEDGVAVLIPDNGETPIEILKKDFPYLYENMGCAVVYNDGGVIIGINEIQKQTDNKAKLMKLFNKRKDNN